MSIEDEEIKDEVLNNEDQIERIIIPPDSLTPEESLRMQLLIISKDILLGKSAMKWETHKIYEDVSVESIIEEANKMFLFVVRQNDES